MLQLRKAARVALERFFLPLAASHKGRIACALLLQKRIERIQPAGIEACRPEPFGRIADRLAQLRHILAVARIIRLALPGEDVQSRIRAECRRHIECIRQEALFAAAVFIDGAVDQLLHNGGVDREALAHKAEALFQLRNVLRSLPDRDGIDGGRIHLPDQLDKARIGLFVGRQRVRAGNAAIGLLDGRLILIIAKVVTGSGKEGGHGVDLLPGIEVRVQHRQRHQQRAAVEAVVLLREVDLAVPHHGAEVALERLVALIVAARLELAVVQEIARQLRNVNAGGGIDGAALLRGHIRRIVRELARRLLQACRNGEKGHVAQRGVLPLCALQLLVLLLAGRKHRAAQLRQLRSQLIFLRPVEEQAEIQVIGVHQGIDRHEIRDLEVTVILIQLEKFIAVPACDDKEVLRQLLLGFVGKPAELIEIYKAAQVRRHRILRQRGRDRLRGRCKA